VTEAQVRLEGVVLTAREVGHLLNNDLQLPLLLLGLLEERDDLPLEVLEMIDLARVGLVDAAEHVWKLQQVVRVETRPTPTGPSLDLERSTPAVA
jgi:hypothetical protein